MRRIGIRQFQQNLHSELASLPIVVTKHGKDWFVVKLASGDNVVTNVVTNKNNVTTLPNPVNVVTNEASLPNVTTKPNVVTSEQSEAIKTLLAKGLTIQEIDKLTDDKEPINRNDPCPIHGKRYWDCFEKHTWGLARLRA